MLMIKSMTKEVFKNRLFLVLLLVMMILTSFMFFFIRFSIDANMAFLNGLSSLTENQRNYRAALNANTGLAFGWLLAITAVTAVVFVMFYFRFYSGAKKQIGCLKALGYTNGSFQLYFAVFALVISLAGLLTGMLAGYFGSSIHIAANMQSYNVSNLVKGVNFSGVLTGLGIPAAVFCLTTVLCSFNLYGKENGELLSGANQNPAQSKLLGFADTCVNFLPIKNKAPLRIALKKPLSILLIIVASTVFTVMLVLGWSLTGSSGAVYLTQTVGHNYKFEAQFESIQTDRVGGDALYYLSARGEVITGDRTIDEQLLFGADGNSALYALQNMAGDILLEPEYGKCYVSPAMHEMYGVAKGDSITFDTGENRIILEVFDIAYNAKSRTVVMSRSNLAEILSISGESYNGVLSLENLYPDADKVISPEDRNEMLERDKVSSATSALLNQAIGVVSGIILIFLALFIAFQDNIKDMLIMDNLGYTRREIKKLLINVFLPILIFGFVIMAFPSVLIAQGVQMSLAMGMGDYMPFSTNALVLLAGLVIVVGIYWLVQLSFNLGIRQITKKKGILQYTNSL